MNVFDFNGTLIQRLVSQGNLNSPWGVALAPAHFGDFSNALLVGNFGDGTINAYDPASGAYLSTLQDSTGTAITIPGLWALRVGNGGNGGDSNTLCFTAGIPGPGNIEDHGLLGSIQAVQAAAPPPALASPVQIVNFSFAPCSLSKGENLLRGTRVSPNFLVARNREVKRN